MSARMEARQSVLGVLVADWSTSTHDPRAMDAIGLSEIVAGVEPADQTGKAAAPTAGLAHDVSILLGVGRQLGWQPRAKVSMTIMRAPQHGHGQGSTRSVSGATSGCC